MANLTIVDTAVKYVKGDDGNQMTAPAGVAIEAGQVVTFDNTTKRWILSGASDATELGDPFIALRTVAASHPLTAVKAPAWLDMGEALASLNFGAKVYVSDDAGELADAAGTVSKVAGTVVPGFGATTPDKLLRVDL